ncbi:BrxA family protein [Cellulophaga sp. L1A9]|uniref:BrxA family protein n=1 Tax=Cellulophaga sp. L1A9 TaxID=2686362 RepID=UPI00131CEED2|nr:BrxA family protein [Cellulophaga sp. L1A9]
MPNKQKYDANFTAGGIFFNEFSNLKPYLLEEDFEEIVKNDIEENKILAITTLSARKRIVSEIIRRHKVMSSGFWSFFQDLNESESKLALLFVCLKTYPIVFDLHFQVTVQKQKLGLLLTEYDVQMRLDELSSSSVDVESWSETTIRKINTQYRTAIKDAGLYNNEKLHKPININQTFWAYFKENDEVWFLDACFI